MVPARVTRFTAQPLTADQLTTALRSLGIAAMGPKNGTITYAAPIRDMAGWGWVARIPAPRNTNRVEGGAIWVSLLKRVKPDTINRVVT